MKTALAALFLSSSLFGQVISSLTEGPVYNRDGQQIAYKYADGTRESYAYDSTGSLVSFVDRAGHVTQFPSAAIAANESATMSASGPPDATLFTTYSIDSGHTNVSWLVCGSTQQTEGCYSSGNLGPFGKVGALIERHGTTDSTTNTVTRFIYVLDIATGSKGNGVTLYAYEKTDMVTASFDTVSVSLFKTLTLPIKGGATGAQASMAENGRSLFVGTNRSPEAVEIQKSDFTIRSIGGFSPPINVSAITTDPYGYVTITFGSFNNFDNGFVVIGPNDLFQEDGGGAEFMLNAKQALLPSTLH